MQKADLFQLVEAYADAKSTRNTVLINFIVPQLQAAFDKMADTLPTQAEALCQNAKEASPP